VRGWLVARTSSLLGGEAHEHGALVLTIELDVARGGWVLGLTSPPLWGVGAHEEEPVYSQVVMPVAAYENNETDEYLNALLAIHFEHLGLLYTGWGILDPGW
jgi:hypothetical protein